MNRLLACTLLSAALALACAPLAQAATKAPAKKEEAKKEGATAPQPTPGQQTPQGSLFVPAVKNQADIKLTDILISSYVPVVKNGSKTALTVQGSSGCAKAGGNIVTETWSWGRGPACVMSSGGQAGTR